MEGYNVLSERFRGLVGECSSSGSRSGEVNTFYSGVNEEEEMEMHGYMYNTSVWRCYGFGKMNTFRVSNVCKESGVQQQG